MQRDYRREVAGGSGDGLSDIEAHDDNGCQSPNSVSESSQSVCLSSREIKGWGESNAPSIASTLRLPTEPLPMIRISTEPSSSTASSSLHNVRTETGVGVPLQAVAGCHVRTHGRE